MLNINDLELKKIKDMSESLEAIVKTLSTRLLQMPGNESNSF